jgi:hypothetical protein
LGWTSQSIAKGFLKETNLKMKEEDSRKSDLKNFHGLISPHHMPAVYEQCTYCPSIADQNLNTAKLLQELSNWECYKV